MRRVAILGPGLLGGSVALALRGISGVEVALWARRPEAVEEAIALDVAHQVSGVLSEVVQGADTVLLSVPVGAMEGLVCQMVPYLSDSALVTDVGSVKEPVVRALAPILKGRAFFVGSHPMAGSEKAGIRHARADLFAGATCILTPDAGQDPEGAAVLRARAFWEGLGCRVSMLSPREHDRVCAMISHMPHLLAAVLVNAVEVAAPHAFDFAGPGFRDTTRVAGGLPEMWREILCENREAVLEAVEALGVRLQQARELLLHPDAAGAEDLLAFLAAAKTRRDTLRIG
jgi:prephenate dehydrogenase